VYVCSRKDETYDYRFHPSQRPGFEVFPTAAATSESGAANFVPELGEPKWRQKYSGKLSHAPMTIPNS
jgi:hypothetical protein